MVPLTTVSVYDVATDTWYEQTTSVADDTERPSDRFDACTVGVSSGDGTSHNIYVYGGTDYPMGDLALSDVYILSIPAFKWIYAGNTSKPRMNHGCTLVSNKYMLMYGGHSIPTDQTDNIFKEFAASGLLPSPKFCCCFYRRRTNK